MKLMWQNSRAYGWSGGAFVLVLVFTAGALALVFPLERALAADTLLTGPTAKAADDTVALEAHGVSFGMNSEAVARLYDRWWDKQFIPKYRKTNPGPKMRELDYELAEKKKILRRIAKFDGRSATFDKAEFAEEFVHGNGEAMTTVSVVRKVKAAAPGVPKAVSYTRRFFFFQDRLWKIYDEYRLEPNGLFGPDFKEASRRVEVSLGSGTKRTRGPDSKWENVVFENGNIRVRVVKLAENRIAVIRSDNALAREVLDRRAQTAVVKEEGLDPDIQAILK